MIDSVTGGYVISGPGIRDSGPAVGTWTSEDEEKPGPFGIDLF
jgi:hypothetical protein